MVFDIDSIDSLKDDIDKKIIANGYMLSGSVKGDRVALFLEDSHGKHSKFTTRTFYGKYTDKKLTGGFRISNFALVWLIVITVLAIENLVTSIIFQGTSGVAVSLGVIIAEIIYFFQLKRLSFEHDLILKEYLNTLNSVKAR